MPSLIFKMLLPVFLLFYGFESPAQSSTDKIERLLQTNSNTGRFIGTIAVSQKGRIIYEKAFGYADLEWKIPNTIDTKYKTGSISKQFVSFLILKLAEQGYVDLNTPIKKYIPEYKGEGADKITLHQLMSHTSEDLAERIGKFKLNFEPGQVWDYSNLGYMLLAYIAEKVTNKPFEELIKKEVFRPLKMYDTKQYVYRSIEERLAKGYKYDLLYGFKNTTHLDNSYVKGSGGIISTVHDMLKWDSALYSNSAITNESLNKMFTPYGYGFGLPVKIIKQDTIKLIYHSGSVNGFQCVFGHIP